ncbi:MAG: GNAT family N-acetyltransferase [Candidatus Diapherotrites archaeon]|nr:GNAT family N-acetyltransferase [Candidatus Diapherotrites archaeon]
MGKLKLRHATKKDAEFVYSMMQNKDFQKHYLERLLYKNVEEARKGLAKLEKQAKRGLVHYFIVNNGTEDIGILDLYKINAQDKKAAIGYGITADKWGKGYGKQVCALGLEIAKKKLKLHTAEATADPENKASIAVLEKNGFKLIGTVEDYYFDRRKFISRTLYYKTL